MVEQQEVRPEIAELYAMHNILLDTQVNVIIALSEQQFALENEFRGLLATIIREYMLNKFAPGMTKPEGQMLQ